MTVDIVNLHIPDKSKTLHNDQVCESLSDYLVITKKIAYSLAHIFGAKTIHRLMQSEDIVSNLATELMMADWQFDGRGKKEGFRKQAIKWRIQHYLNRSKAAYNKKKVSLSHELEFGNILGDILPEMASLEPDASESMQYAERMEELKSLMDSDVITNKQHHFIMEYYIQGKTLQVIANETGATKEAVRISIKNGINKLRELAREKNICA
jgi:RNA polymerase sigma factor (sigma-70 family)